MKRSALQGRKIGGRYQGRILYGISVSFGAPTGPVAMTGRFPVTDTGTDTGTAHLNHLTPAVS